MEYARQRARKKVVQREEKIKSLQCYRAREPTFDFLTFSVIVKKVFRESLF